MNEELKEYSDTFCLQQYEYFKSISYDTHIREHGYICSIRDKYYHECIARGLLKQ